MTSTSTSTIQFERSNFICSLAFLADGKHIVGGGFEGKIRRWRLEDGREVGAPMDAGDSVLGLAASQDGKWVVSGTNSGLVMVWNAETHSKVNEFQAHPKYSIEAVDVSPDGTRIATGSHDTTVCVWSFSTHERLLGPLRHGYILAAVKYSYDGRLLAAATCETPSIWIYDSRDGRPLVNIPVQIGSIEQSLAWSRNSKHLFALSDDSIQCFDVFTGTVLSGWPIHSGDDPKGIAQASNGRFIAAAAESFISFWDTMTHERIGPVIEHTDILLSMAISPNHDLVTSGAKSTVLLNLRDILPSPYCENIACEPEISPIVGEKHNIEETINLLLTDVRDLRAQQESSQRKIATLENTVQELRTELAEFQRKADWEKNKLNITIKSLHAEARTQDENRR